MPVFDEAASSCSSPPPARITPTSAASRRARCRPTARTSTRRACCSTTSSSWTDGRLREAELLELLRSGPWPARNATQNVADLQAQMAALPSGARTSSPGWSTQFGLATVRAYMGHVQDNAEESVRRVLDVLQDGEFRLRARRRADGRRCTISIDKAARRARVDFTGTGAAAALELQRARGGDPRGRALRLPHPGRRGHPDERGLPEADRHRPARGLDRRLPRIRPPSAPATSRPRSG